MKRIIILIFFLGLSLMTYADKEKWDDNKDEWSDLMLAIYNGQTNKCIDLIEKGENVNYETPGIKTNWKLTAIEVAIRKENSEAVKVLVQTKKITHLNEHLMTAAGQRNSATIELLIKFGANPKDTLDNGYSILMMAASTGSFEVLESLLKHGADVKQVRKADGITALMLAAFNGDIRKVRLLLDYKAIKYIKDKNGETALDYVDKIYPYLKVSESTKNELKEILK